MEKIIIKKDNILKQKVDAIVNPANNDLLHGGGLSAAIVEAGGAIIQDESNKIGPIAIGEACVTGAGKLKVKYIIHAASMKLGELTDEENLVRSINNSFERARELGISSIAFPAVGAGIGRFPVQRCAKICLDAAVKFIEQNPDFKQIIFVLSSDKNFQAFDAIYRRLNTK